MSKTTTIVYKKVYQEFIEYNEDGVILKTGSFKIPERVETILENDHATVVFLNDNSKGVSLCHPADTINPSVGRRLAYLRAKLVSIQSEIKQILKSTYSK